VVKTFNAWITTLSAKGSCSIRTMGTTCLRISDNCVLCMRVYVIRCLY
jgi:hypothetical protein